MCVLHALCCFIEEVFFIIHMNHDCVVKPDLRQLQVYTLYINIYCMWLKAQFVVHVRHYVVMLLILLFPQALVLPQAIATPTGGIILDMFERLRCDIGLGYIILFLVTSVYFVLSGIFVFNIKKAK